MEHLMHIFVILGLVISAGCVCTIKKLLSAAIALAIFSFLLALEFYILQAPDVAIAEAGIGAGLTTAILIIAIRGTGSKGGDEQ
jgi:uncharacterized MnhB-related membrane protein